MEEFGLFLLLFGLITLILWIYAIYDIVKGSLSGNNEKIIWLLVVIFFPVLGALCYLLFGRKSSAG